MSKTGRIAAPSWVFPGSVLENCRFLEGKVDEAALLFFDAESSLAYTRQDLPPELSSLSLSYHVHLPSSLPWDKGGGAVAALCLTLMEKVEHIAASRCVLHPPAADSAGAGANLLEAFAREWEKAGRSLPDICVENTRENDLAALITRGFFDDTGVGVCFDLGHMIAYEQHELVRLVSSSRASSVFGGSTVRMIHYTAPGRGGESGEKSAHLPLTTLDGAGMALGETLCALLSPEGIVVAEFFSWDYVVASLPIIRRWLAKRARNTARGG